MKEIFIRKVELVDTVIERFPFTIPAVRALPEVEFAPITMLVGENGAGKSTCVEALAVAAGMNPEGGSSNFSFGTRTSHSSLYADLRLIRGARRERTSWFLRAESYFTAATYLEELPRNPLRPYGGKSLHEMSHGESFLALALNRFGPDGLYILDEPEAALSPLNQLALAIRLQDLTRQGCQIVVATHSPILAAIPSARIYELTARGIQQSEWAKLDSVALYRDFMAAPDRYFEDE